MRGIVYFEVNSDHLSLVTGYIYPPKAVSDCECGSAVRGGHTKGFTSVFLSSVFLQPVVNGLQ